jgi:glycosyltransferase involved in cell wall biosynthesis
MSSGIVVVPLFQFAYWRTGMQASASGAVAGISGGRSGRSMPEPSVSVLLPVLNAATFLPAALDSILAQTFADFELIALDGGSRDGSLELLRAAAARDPRVQVVVEPGKALIEKLNLGLARARAPLIARMDADDIARPDRLAKQCEFMRRHPEIVAVSGAVDIIDEAGRYVETIAFPTLPDAVAAELIFRPIVVHPAVMMRSEAVRPLGYRPIARHAEDYDLWLRLVERGPIANLPDVLLSYRTHATNVSRLRFVESEFAVMAARAAARRRRAGAEDPLEISERREPGTALSLARLRALFGRATFAHEFAYPFFRGTLTKASDMGVLPAWLRLFLRYGLAGIGAADARMLLLLAGSLALKRRRAGAGLLSLWPYGCLAALIGARHPVMAARETLHLRRWRTMARAGLLGPRAG